MSRSEHPHPHERDQLQRNRLRIAQEAARLISEHGIRDFHHAKLKAAERLRISDTQSLPQNAEVEQALREHQRLFLAGSQPRWLHQRRLAAVDAMHFLAAFEPRLIGAVLEGTADAHSPVCLHVFSDDADAVTRYLRDNGVPAEIQARHLQHHHPDDDQTEYPVLLFNAGELPFDLTVLPRDALRQAPRDPIDDRPMRRASLSQLQALLHSENAEPLAQLFDPVSPRR
ncbi:MAG: hypothetical protein ABI114_11620 [Rhodanobacter sp.]